MERAPTIVRARDEIEAFLLRDPTLHLYELGDLDPFFWPYTTWYGLRGEDGGLRALALLYTGADMPTVLALGRGDDPDLAALTRSLQKTLPRRCYAHLAPALMELARALWEVEPHGAHEKMALRDPSGLGAPDGDGDDIIPLGPGDLAEVRDMYERSYPGNWFVPRMLETGCYRGLRVGGRLACVAGVHVYSPRYRVAALGNITTAPELRGRGLARRVTAALCSSLLESGIEVIGLNVKSDNVAAIACYRGLGFEHVAAYEELVLVARGE